MSDPSNKSYKIETLLDIAKIPREAIPRFLEELPRLLDQVRPLIKFVQDTEQLRVLFLNLAIWNDDGKVDGSGDVIKVTIQT